MGSNHGKNRGGKSRGTLPLRKAEGLMLTAHCTVQSYCDVDFVVQFLCSVKAAVPDTEMIGWRGGGGGDDSRVLALHRK